MNFNLFMAALWLLLGGYCFFLRPDWTFGNTGLSIGWLGVVMALYNLTRWWSTRSYRRERAAALEAERQHHQETLDRDRPPREPDPNFDFGSPPRPEEPPR